LRPSSNISSRHELPVGQQIVDIRPFSDRYAEWISDGGNLLSVAVPVALATALMPVAALVTLPFLAISSVVFVGRKQLLPARYPLDGKDPKGKPGDGILYMGAVDDKSPFENFKEIWLSDDDLRKHMLILGSTGSGKSEALKAVFFNALNWSSGFFIADGKADNKLPTDTYTMARSVGRDQDVLFLNFLLAGKTPEQVRRSRTRRSNGLNPFPAADADTIIQMGANMLPKVEGDAKNWQEKALNLWRSMVSALCYRRDKFGMELSVSTFIDYLALDKIEELYMEGYREAQENDGEWSYGFVGIKSYLDSGVPSYMVSKLLKKHGYGPEEAPPQTGGRGPGFGGGGGKSQNVEQDSHAYEQHSNRANQLQPVLNLLDKTYGYIFRDRYSEIDMTDVTLRNRILVMLIPSLEKSAAEAENLGKLAIACLRVMMAKNLGSEIEGNPEDLLGSKATNSPYPYVVALDELAYYFSDGIAVMFAQARSLGTSMIAAAQDLEKLTEGNRAAEAGAMLANQTIKNFMRIDDANKTPEMIQKIVGKVYVAVKKDFRRGAFGFERTEEVDIMEVDRVTSTQLKKFKQGDAVLNAMGETSFMKWFYMGHDLLDHRVPRYRVNRFLQVPTPTPEEVIAHSVPLQKIKDPYQKGQSLVAKLDQREPVDLNVPADPMLAAVQDVSMRLNPHAPAEERAICLYMAARAALLAEDERQARAEGRKVPAAEPDLVNGAAPATVVPERAVLATEAGGLVMDVEDDAVDLNSVLGFQTPFQRKPQELLGLDEPVVRYEEPPPVSLGGDPFEALVRLPGRQMRLRTQQEVEAEASRILPLPTRDWSAASGPADDWISLAQAQAAEMVNAPRSSDNTVVGFTEQTMSKVVVAERLLDSPDPNAAARHVERVVAVRITPVTQPESLKDADDDNALALLDTLAEKVGAKR